MLLAQLDLDAHFGEATAKRWNEEPIEEYYTNSK
jgi:hypothetical protein